MKIQAPGVFSQRSEGMARVLTANAKPLDRLASDRNTFSSDQKYWSGALAEMTSTLFIGSAFALVNKKWGLSLTPTRVMGLCLGASAVNVLAHRIFDTQYDFKREAASNFVSSSLNTGAMVLMSRANFSKHSHLMAAQVFTAGLMSTANALTQEFQGGLQKDWQSRVLKTTAIGSAGGLLSIGIGSGVNRAMTSSMTQSKVIQISLAASVAGASSAAITSAHEAWQGFQPGWQDRLKNQTLNGFASGMVLSFVPAFQTKPSLEASTSKTEDLNQPQIKKQLQNKSLSLKTPALKQFDDMLFDHLKTYEKNKPVPPTFLLNEFGQAIPLSGAPTMLAQSILDINGNPISSAYPHLQVTPTIFDINGKALPSSSQFKTVSKTNHSSGSGFAWFKKLGFASSMSLTGVPAYQTKTVQHPADLPVIPNFKAEHFKPFESTQTKLHYGSVIDIKKPLLTVPYQVQTIWIIQNQLNSLAWSETQPFVNAKTNQGFEQALSDFIKPSLFITGQESPEISVPSAEPSALDTWAQAMPAPVEAGLIIMPEAPALVQANGKLMTEPKPLPPDIVDMHGQSLQSPPPAAAKTILDQDGNPIKPSLKEHIYQDLFQDPDLQERAVKLLSGWTSAYSSSITQTEMRKAFSKIMAGQAPESPLEHTIFDIYTTRRERWLRLSDKLGLDGVPESFQLYRGTHSKRILEAVVTAWKDTQYSEMQVPAHELSSWSMSRATAQSFAFDSEHSVIFEAQIPFERTLADKFVDDGTFISPFFGEQEVVVATAQKNGITTPKDKVTILFQGKQYDYSQRADLIKAWDAHQIQTKKP